MTAPAPYLAAAVQFEPTLGDVGGNVEKLLALTEAAFERGARLVVLPEMATTGYCWTDRREVAPYVEAIPGPTTEGFGRLAARHQGWVVVGMPEVEEQTNAFFNSAALIGATGVAGVYRKTHAYITETRWARDGDLGVPVFETPLGRLGILICMDAEYPEAARLLACSKCDIVCFPTNWLGEKAPSAFWITRAYENGAYWIASNRHGLERGVQFSGGSAIIGPDGSLLEVVDAGDGIAIAEIDVAQARKERADRLRDRRPAIYQPLTLNSYLWPSANVVPAHDGAALDGVAGGATPMTARVAVVSRIADEPTDVFEALRALLAQQPVDLVVLPTLVQGRVGSEDLSDLQTRTSETLVGLSRVATEHGVHVVVGGPFVEGDVVSDATVLLAPDGQRFTHRRTYDPLVIHTALGPVGLLCGDELLLPEPARLLAVRGAELIAVPADLDDPAPIALGETAVPLEPPEIRTRDPLHSLLPRVRAAENNAWLAFANHGLLPSGIFGPSFYRFPRSEALANDAGIAMLALEDASTRDRAVAVKKPYLRMRLPHLYGPLTVPPEFHGD